VQRANELYTIPVPTPRPMLPDLGVATRGGQWVAPPSLSSWLAARARLVDIPAAWVKGMPVWPRMTLRVGYCLTGCARLSDRTTPDSGQAGQRGGMAAGSHERTFDDLGMLSYGFIRSA
jgi:hypothetical protein